MTSYWAWWGCWAAWVAYDGYRRSAGAMTILWVLGTCVIGPIALPLYFARRPLMPGQQRIGGFGWNVLKNFAIIWTLTMIYVVVIGMNDVEKLFSASRSAAETVDLRIGTVKGLFDLGVVWFIPTAVALLLGFLQKNDSIIDTN